MPAFPLCDCGSTAGCEKCTPQKYPPPLAKELGSIVIVNGMELRSPKSLDEILERLSELYTVYYHRTGDVFQHRMDIEQRLHELLLAYNTWLA